MLFLLFIPVRLYFTSLATIQSQLLAQTTNFSLKLIKKIYKVEIVRLNKYNYCIKISPAFDCARNDNEQFQQNPGTIESTTYLFTRKI